MLPTSSSLNKSTNIGLAVGCIVAFIIMIVANYLAATGVTNTPPGEQSDKYWTGIAAAGWTFSIWSIIFVLQAVFVIYSLVLAIRSHPIHCLPTLTAFLIPNFLLNASWNVIFGHDHIFIALCVIVGILVTAIVMYILLTSDAAPAHPADEGKAMVDAGGVAVALPTHTDDPRSCLSTMRRWVHPLVTTLWVRIYVAWLSVATVLSVSIVLKYTFGFQNDHPDAWRSTPTHAPTSSGAVSMPITSTERYFTLLMLAVVLVLGALFVAIRKDGVPSLVFAWASFGVASRASTMHSLPGSEEVKERWEWVLWAAVAAGTINILIGAVGLALAFIRARRAHRPLTEF